MDTKALYIALDIGLPCLLIVRAFMLSRKSKGWYTLSVAGLIYTFGVMWLLTTVMAILGDAAAYTSRAKQLVPAGLPLFVSLLVCSELLYWAPQWVANLRKKYQEWRTGRNTEKPAQQKRAGKSKRS